MNPQTETPATGAEHAAKPAAGHIALVGAGPGDAELLTLRGAALLGQADVVLTFREPPHLARHRKGLLSHCRPDTVIVDPDEYGDSGDAFALSKAAQGLRVVRLYPGDPLLSGQGAALAEAASDAGIEFEIVPGLSSITAVPAYAGTELLPHGTNEVRILDAADTDVDWVNAAQSKATLVVLHPDAPTEDDPDAKGPGLDRICKTLIAGGRPDTTPVTVTRMGTTTYQTTITSTLARLAADLKAADAKGHTIPRPSLLIVGEGVAQRQKKLSWFETKPLFGWRVLVPRTRQQAPALSEQLRSYGAVPEEVPTISVEPPRTPQQMERAVRGLVTGRYQWVAFTSVNAVKAIRERIEDYGLDARAFAGVKVAAVGEQTAAALRAFGIHPDLQPPEDKQSAAGLVEVWPPYDPDIDPIERVLLPRADIATEVLSEGLVNLGWEVDDVTAYRTVRAAPPPAPIREAIKGGGFDAVMFTSSSTVRNLVGIAGKPHATTVIAVIGPETAKTADEFGLRVDVRAPKASVAALAEALAEFGAAQRQAAIEAGKPVLRPSQKRRGRRRKNLMI